MNTRMIRFLAFTLCVLLISNITAVAEPTIVQGNIIALNATYKASEGMIVVSGEADENTSGIVAFQIIKPDGNILYFGTLEIDDDREFGGTVNVGRIAYGTYTVKAADNMGGLFYTTTFAYTRSGSSPITITPIEEEKDEWIESSDSLDAYYTDIPVSYSWAAKAINFLSQRGIVQGIGDNQFGPSLSFKRGDIMLMIVNAFGLTAVDGQQFGDVEETKYYAQAIMIAKSLGVARGDNGKFSPEERISRQDAIVLLHRTLDILGITLPTDESDKTVESYDDGESVSDYAKIAMTDFIKAGIVKGDGVNLHPSHEVSRAEMATILYRIIEFLEKTS